LHTPQFYRNKKCRLINKIKNKKAFKEAWRMLDTGVKILLWQRYNGITVNILEALEYSLTICLGTVYLKENGNKKKTKKKQYV
jgi:hypothetical protein